MINLLLFMLAPLTLPLLVWYFSTWNDKDPYYQKYIQKYGEKALRDYILKR